jgi:MFS family permease
MGVGGALMIPSTLSIITTMYPDQRERQRAISMWAATTGFGVALGPIIGGSPWPGCHAGHAESAR